ncbi:hypothetical protein Tco_1091605 [Tanacetum coccineum]|uniref:Uncharacterized protein n=1 Tax=Tanacetum coccineum TaxID=301880 RepID=A0ABQ5I9F2_9ASTR
MECDSQVLTKKTGRQADNFGPSSCHYFKPCKTALFTLKMECDSQVQTSLALLAKDVVIAGILKKLTFNEERWFFKRSIKVSRSGKAPSQWKMIIPNRESVWNKYLYLGTYRQCKLKNHVLSEDWLITQATENYDVPTHVLSSSEVGNKPMRQLQLRIARFTYFRGFTHFHWNKYRVGSEKLSKIGKA